MLETLRSRGHPQQAAEKPYPHLTHLLPTSITVPMLEQASEEYVDNLLKFLPPALITMDNESSSEPTPAEMAIARGMSLRSKKRLLTTVLRAPQFYQALASLTMALRDGGLPSIADALGIKVSNNGYMKGGAMPLGGGEAVETFVNGVKESVERKE